MKSIVSGSLNEASDSRQSAFTPIEEKTPVGLIPVSRNIHFCITLLTRLPSPPSDVTLDHEATPQSTSQSTLAFSWRSPGGLQLMRMPYWRRQKEEGGRKNLRTRTCLIWCDWHNERANGLRTPVVAALDSHSHTSVLSKGHDTFLFFFPRINLSCLRFKSNLSSVTYIGTDRMWCCTPGPSPAGSTSWALINPHHQLGFFCLTLDSFCSRIGTLVSHLR